LYAQKVRHGETVRADCSPTVNFVFMFEPKGIDAAQLTEVEKKGIERAEDFIGRGRAYAIEHSTRPGTIGLVLSSSPLAFLAW
jgi:microsomal epoxide hydrolase